MTRTRGLGRGLGALIPTRAGGLEEVDVDLIVPNPHQPRAAIDETGLEELAESIREHGVLQPLVVSASDSAGVFQLIAGERRLRAARMAGLKRVPVVVKEAASKELLEIALVENLQREDLNPLEEAQAYRRLADEFKLTQEEIAGRVGRSRTAVSNSMRLLGLSDEMKSRLASGAISEGHARALLGLEDKTARSRALREVLERGLTVRQTEELVRRWPANGATKARAGAKRRGDPDIASLETRLREATGTKVGLHRNARGRGKIVLHFFSDEELESLLSQLGVAMK